MARGNTVPTHIMQEMIKMYNEVGSFKKVSDAFPKVGYQNVRLIIKEQCGASVRVAQDDTTKEVDEEVREIAINKTINEIMDGNDAVVEGLNEILGLKINDLKTDRDLRDEEKTRDLAQAFASVVDTKIKFERLTMEKQALNGEIDTTDDKKQEILANFLGKLGD